MNEITASVQARRLVLGSGGVTSTLSDPKTILIADDNELILATFKLAFEEYGHRVLLAANGKAVLAHLSNSPVDLLVLDILMPEMDGLETIVEVKRRFPNLPIFVMSGGARRNHDFLPIARKFGATGVIYKPITPRDLIHVIEATMLDHAHSGLHLEP